MSKIWLGLDNGAAGSIGIINEDGKAKFGVIPHKLEQSYTKKEQGITRIDAKGLYDLLKHEVWSGMDENYPSNRNKVFALVERPFTSGPEKIKAVVSGMRALEAVLIVLEMLEIPYQYIDSKEWQKALLPEGIKGTPELKAASLQIGTRLFPQIVSKHKDRDGLLIALYAKRKDL